MRPRAPAAQTSPVGATVSALKVPASKSFQVCPSVETSDPEVPVAIHRLRAGTHSDGGAEAVRTGGRHGPRAAPIGGGGDVRAVLFILRVIAADDDAAVGIGEGDGEDAGAIAVVTDGRGGHGPGAAAIGGVEDAGGAGAAGDVPGVAGSADNHAGVAGGEGASLGSAGGVFWRCQCAPPSAVVRISAAPSSASPTTMP